VLGQVYEYFLGMFANAEGKRGGQFYTPRSIVKTLVSVLAPHHGKVYDPCCGSGGMFVQSEEFIEAHGGKIGDVAIFGQEANPTTWRLAAINLAIRGIDFNLGKAPGDTFTQNQSPTCAPTSSWPTRPSTSATGGTPAWWATPAGTTATRRPATPITPGCSTCCTT
jgi:type I restriction-modification system DNA methylase subunit